MTTRLTTPQRTRRGNYQTAKAFLDDLERLRDERYQEVKREVAAGVRWVGKGRK